MKPFSVVTYAGVTVVMSLVLGNVTSLDQTLKDHILKLHNDYRSKQGASNMIKLEWDDQLASEAQQWADRCVFKHKGMGENLAWNSNVDKPEQELIDTAMQNFYNEIERYTYGTASCGSFAACHYTQIVWAKTRKVGCSTKVCPRLAQAYDKKTWFLVCRYDPVGNWVGEYPFQKGAACSECQGATCEGGLCVGGASGSEEGNEECADSHENCADWAEREECSRNPDYMLKSCKKSCGECGKTTGDSASGAQETVASNRKTECADSHENCGDWAEREECSRNPAYMLNSCKKSCGECGKTTGDSAVAAQQTGGTVSADKQTECKDQNENCAAWAGAGYCKKDAYTKTHCKKSCRTCR